MKSWLPQGLADRITSRTSLGALQTWARTYAHPSYSQDGEDLLILSLLAEPRQPGFYVDVGAHHPARFSNTLLFYLKGWRGINIDPLPGCMEVFKRMRPLDINLELGISDAEGDTSYYMFNDPALNTFCEELTKSRHPYYVEKKVAVPTKPLRAIFAEHLPPNTPISFLNVDVEGMDLVVLKSNDWSKWRPAMVIAEDNRLDMLSGIDQTDLGCFMRSVGYVACAKTRLNVLFVEPSCIDKSQGGIKIQHFNQNQQPVPNPSIYQATPYEINKIEKTRIS